MLKKSLIIALITFAAFSALPTLSSCPPACNSSCATNCSTGCQNNCDGCSCPCSGKTFFTNRPLFQSYRPELWAGFRNDVMEMGLTPNYKDNLTGAALDIVVYGSRSSRAQDLAQYFLPYCKNKLTVREKVTQGDGTDLQASNFGIFTIEGTNPLVPGGFESEVSFCAKHTELGIGFHWKQGFGYNRDDSTWWYLDVDLPITYVKNQFTISENVLNDGGGISTGVAATGIPVSANMTIAMQQSAWNYGKVSNCCNLSKTGIADMELKFGRQFVYRPSCMFASYLGILIPTGNTPCGKFIFEPIVGHNKSTGFIWGTEGGYELWNNCDSNWGAWIDYACQALYLFKHCQIRSFDLKNRPWSRYISVYRDQTQASQANGSADLNVARYLSTPGINVFTQPVQVTPGFQTNTTASLVFTRYTGLSIELGWNVFFRSAECVDLNWQTGPAIVGENGGGTTNPVLNISDSPLLQSIVVPFADYNSSLIQSSDIDIQSAAHPTIISQLLYTSLGYAFNDRGNPLYCGFGLSYEFAQTFAVMNRWTLWAKFNVSF